jgi:hypothetical protein
MRIIYTSKGMSKIWGARYKLGARYTLGARYLSKNTVICAFSGLLVRF